MNNSELASLDFIMASYLKGKDKMSYLEQEIVRLLRIIEILTTKYDDAERKAARLEAWSTKLFNKLYAIECGDCGSNMVACKCDDEEER